MRLLCTTLLCCFLIFNTLLLSAQSIEIKAENQPLAEVLSELKQAHSIQISYPDEALKDCLINQNKNYDNMEEAINSLLQNCHLSYRIIEEVFVIYKETQATLFSGQIIDSESRESIPFATLQINDSFLTSDVNGQFSFKAKTNSVQVKVRHLGYYHWDGVYPSLPNQAIALLPKVVGLEEVVVEGRKIIPSITARESALGLTKMNHQVATFLAGNNEHSIFNLLRLQAGILAAGEQAKDFFIWGSYKGQTQIVFDGMTLFNISSINDDIGAINPLIVKDVEVHKGGYQVDIGDRVGGLVNINSLSGNAKEWSTNIQLSTQLANGLINIPLGKEAALQLGFRTQFKSPFDKFQSEEAQLLETDFNDINIKLTNKTKKGDTYFLSFLVSKDRYSAAISESDGKEYFLDTYLENQQLGGSFFYSKKWAKGGLTNFTLAHSQLDAESINESKLSTDIIDFQVSQNATLNEVSESSLKVQHFFPATDRHTWTVGGNLISNSAGFEQDSSSLSLKDNTQFLQRIEAYVKDEIRLTKRWSIQPGIKLSLPFSTLSPNIQPRVNSRFKVNNWWQMELAYGIYTQFLAENAIIDNFGNALFFWSIDNQSNKNLLSGQHWVWSQRMIYKSTEFKIETYFKNTDGLSRWLAFGDANNLKLFNGKSRTYGLDVALKTNIQKHHLGLSYTLSKTEELFDYFSTKTYQRAPQDQRHELKGVGILNFYPFYFSLNYVYGSGFPNAIKAVSNEKIIDYSRMDIALLYRITKVKWHVEMGASIVNLFNTKNVRYNNFSNFPDNKTLYAPAMPFTPSIFVKFGF